MKTKFLIVIFSLFLVICSGAQANADDGFDLYLDMGYTFYNEDVIDIPNLSIKLDSATKIQLGGEVNITEEISSSVELGTLWSTGTNFDIFVNNVRGNLLYQLPVDIIETQIKGGFGYYGGSTQRYSRTYDFENDFGFHLGTQINREISSDNFTFRAYLGYRNLELNFEDEEDVYDFGGIEFTVGYAYTF